MKNETIFSRLSDIEWGGENDPGIEWLAVVWAGLVSGVVFLLAGSIAVAIDLGGNAWGFLKLVASMLLGPETIFEPLGIGTILVGLIIHMVISILATALLVLVIHRWGLYVGIIGGALIGLAIFSINFYFISFLQFYWFAGLVSTSMAFAHMIWGATAGGIYELLDED